MPESSVVATVERLIAPVLAARQVELYDLEYVLERGGWVLRVFIDKPGGVFISDCEAVSRAAEAVLDAHDPIPNAYRLEISSPGVDRKLVKASHYARYAGETVVVKLYRPLDHKKTFTGRLIGLCDGNIIIDEPERGELCFEQASVAWCRLRGIL